MNSSSWLKSSLALVLLSTLGMAVADTVAGKVVLANRQELSTTVSGIVRQVNARVGRQVEKDEVLVELDQRQFKSNLAMAKASLVSARAKSAEFKRELDRAKELYDRTVLSDRDLQVAKDNYLAARAELASAKAELTRAELELEYSQIKAPYKADVLAVLTNEGQSLSAQLTPKPLVVITEASKRIARAEVELSTINQLKAGQAITVEVGGISYQGQVHQLGIEALENNRYQLDVLFDSQGKLLREGQPVTLEF